MGRAADDRPVRRRTLLAAVAVLAGAAGCSSESGPTETPTEADYVERFRLALSAGAAEFAEVRVRVADGVARLTYETAASAGADRSTVRDAIARETRAVASSYASVVGAGWSVDRLAVTVEQTDAVVATYHVRRTWAEDFNGPNRSSDRYARRIQSTLEIEAPATATGSRTPTDGAEAVAGRRPSEPPH